MPITRYSAAEIFGVPLENRSDVQNVGTIVAVMKEHGVGGQVVTEEGPENITPPYWRDPVTYWLKLVSPELAEIHILPKDLDAGGYAFTKIGAYTAVFSGVRLIEIPTDQPSVLIASRGSPRYPGQICAHEIITAERFDD